MQDALESAHPTQQQLLLKDQRIHELRAQVAALEKRVSAAPAVSTTVTVTAPTGQASAVGHAASCPAHHVPVESPVVTQAHYAAQAAHATVLQAVERRADDAERRAQRADETAAALKRDVDEQEYALRAGVVPVSCNAFVWQAFIADGGPARACAQCADGRSNTSVFNCRA